MGLVGCLLAPVVTGTDLWLMTPAEFVRHPLAYLRCFGEHGACLTAMPTFGLEHILRRVRPQALAGLDFSHWRAVIAGAERIAAPTLRRFAELCGPQGFSPTALLPAYGLAEATLAVSGLPLRTGWRSEARSDGTVVGCGPALPGTAITIVDDRGRPVPDGVEGEIVVRGESVASGGVLATGDAGFLKDGQLYVLGRMGDSLKIRGKTLFAEDVDAAVLSACGAAPNRLASLLGMVGQQPTVVILMERPEPGWAEAASAAARVLAENARIEVVAVPVGGIDRTSSGKPRRRPLWHAHLPR
jgi:acyl-CoA synthetase (AMP-forming)/AMP-acid ligase II